MKGINGIQSSKIWGFRKTRSRGFRTISADGMNEPSADINGLDSPDVRAPRAEGAEPYPAAETAVSVDSPTKERGQATRGA